MIATAPKGLGQISRLESTRSLPSLDPKTLGCCPRFIPLTVSSRFPQWLMDLDQLEARWLRHLARHCTSKVGHCSCWDQVTTAKRPLVSFWKEAPGGHRRKTSMFVVKDWGRRDQSVVYLRSAAPAQPIRSSQAAVMIWTRGCSNEGESRGNGSSSRSTVVAAANTRLIRLLHACLTSLHLHGEGA